jgi:hypothetical protein
MSAEKALATISPAPTAGLATVMGVAPKELMAYALEIADTLSSVLRDRGMTQKFGGTGEHVKTEGWQLAGSLMGFTVSEGPATELPDGSFEATVELRSISSGKTLAVASARCGVDEATWKSKPKYARRSMAYTRAIGRAYAQNFRWLIHLAGYEGTPAEEMPDEMAKKQAPVTYRGTDAQQKELATALEQRKVDESLWEAVGKHMLGKPIGPGSLKVAIDLAIADAGSI